MKILFIIFFCATLNQVQAQELKITELLAPESKEITDLSFLKEELKGRQLVLLGEHTHGHGNIFEMKARVVEYLHRELGFTTFAMESPMYEIWRMNKIGFTKEGFNDAVFSVWSETSEFQRLVNYLDKNKLKVIGFDSQVNDAPNFTDDFFNYLEKENIDLKLDQDDMGIIIEGVLTIQKFDEQDIKFKSFEKELHRITKEIEKLEDSEDNYNWRQFTKSLLACAQDAFLNVNPIYSTVVGDKDYNIRDKQMADNLLTYVKRHPEEKIIGWADNIHFINDNSSITKPIAKDFISMGSYIKKELKDKVYSLATMHANDSLLNIKNYKWTPTPVRNNSFENDLKKLGKPYLFVSSNQDAMKVPKFTRLFDLIDFSEARVDQLHDGYIFFQHATSPKLEYEREVLSKKHEEAIAKLSQSENNQTIVFKGQIFDLESNESIPFATVVIKKENIYRVADENGKFEFTLEKSKNGESSVEISSIGYETKKAVLEALSDKVYLKNQFEQLAEVVIKKALAPKAVLKKAISDKKINHPNSPFNFKRYSKILINKNDKSLVDLELITKDYNQGYQTQFITTQRVEQVRWNAKAATNKYQTSSQFFGFRENPVQYSNILHKRKYKKFELKYVTSEEKDSENWYIIEFSTQRNKWSYTNKTYPTKYLGRVYIDKENFAILKVVENWETSLSRDEIKKYFKHEESMRNISQATSKQENTVEFTQVNNDGKYYATKYFTRTIVEKITDSNQFENSLSEISSMAFDFEIEDVELLEYEHRARNNTILNRVLYDENYWSDFNYRNDVIKNQ